MGMKFRQGFLLVGRFLEFYDRCEGSFEKINDSLGSNAGIVDSGFYRTRCVANERDLQLL